MTEFQVGDIIQEQPYRAHPGMVARTQQFKVLAVYHNLIGPWYAVEAVGGHAPGDQVAVSSPEPGYAVVGHALPPLPPPWTPAPVMPPRPAPKPEPWYTRLWMWLRDWW